MLVEKWKDIAFGSDYGMDFLEFLQDIPTEPLTLSAIYQHCDIQQYFANPELLTHRKDTNIFLDNAEGEQFVHYDEAVIALCAIVAECLVNGKADLTNAYGSKIIIFDISPTEIALLNKALSDILYHSEKYNLFEMLSPDETQETQRVLSEILENLV